MKKQQVIEAVLYLFQLAIKVSDGIKVITKTELDSNEENITYLKANDFISLFGELPEFSKFNILEKVDLILCDVPKDGLILQYAELRLQNTIFKETGEIPIDLNYFAYLMWFANNPGKADEWEQSSNEEAKASADSIEKSIVSIHYLDEVDDELMSGEENKSKL